jgi:hypothetical protein
MCSSGGFDTACHKLHLCLVRALFAVSCDVRACGCVRACVRACVEMCEGAAYGCVRGQRVWQRVRMQRVRTLCLVRALFAFACVSCICVCGGQVSASVCHTVYGVRA